MLEHAQQCPCDGGAITFVQLVILYKGYRASKDLVNISDSLSYVDLYKIPIDIVSIYMANKKGWKSQKQIL